MAALLSAKVSGAALPGEGGGGSERGDARGARRQLWVKDSSRVPRRRRGGGAAPCTTARLRGFRLRLNGLLPRPAEPCILLRGLNNFQNPIIARSSPRLGWAPLPTDTAAGCASGAAVRLLPRLGSFRFVPLLSARRHRPLRGSRPAAAPAHKKGAAPRGPRPRRRPHSQTAPGARPRGARSPIREQGAGPCWGRGGGGARARGEKSWEQLFPIPTGPGREEPPAAPTPRAARHSQEGGGAQAARSGWPEQTKINWLLSERALKMRTAACARSY